MVMYDAVDGGGLVGNRFWKTGNAMRVGLV